MKDILVKTYQSDRALQRDANKLAKRGYEIASVEKDAKSGCLRWVLIGPLALIFKSHSTTVTYWLARES